MVLINVGKDVARRDLARALETRPMPAAAEQAFGRCIVDGRKAGRLLAASRTLSSEERAKLESLQSLGRWARDRLVEYNLPLVLNIARRYGERGIDLEDLRQEGTIGLMRAIEGFDWDRGLRLSTYATFWIRQAIVRAIADRGRLIRLPVNAQDTLRAMSEAALGLSSQLGRQPTIAEIAAAVSISPRRAAQLLQAVSDAVSFENASGPESRPLEEVIGADQPGPEEVAIGVLVGEDLDALLDAVLAPREAEVIRLRFGLRDGIEWTLEAIGARIGVTRERARQLEASALAKLREAAQSELVRAKLVAA